VRKIGCCAKLFDFSLSGLTNSFCALPTVNEYALRRRRLQAQRTQRCRQRQKAKELSIETPIHQVESSQTVDSAAEDVQTRLGNNLLADTGKFGPDTIPSGELSITLVRKTIF
jgi:hypothetical protein